ncbi:dihydrofolate reductase family protein [Pannus brasiliensis CCIBt3594]|uniref:Dihydrofolate reductase family protein n=1 Tax=Pannus brasiliensis CCIBt3594 TaxID=1427578 RepID=A0AAW9QNX4_9CHRO
MTSVVYYVAMSVDGYIATPDGSIDWLGAYEIEGEDYGYREFYDSIDALLLGRRTYEQILGFGSWPYPGKPCFVFSRTPLSGEIPEVTFTPANPRETVAELRERGWGRVWLVGGGQLAGSFRESGSIDELIVSVMPIVLGSGIPLFGVSGKPDKLTPIASRSYPNGCIQLQYRLDSRRDRGE